ncbi:MAG TPA: hypothetical protein VFP11_12810 [Candidatus Angelobacter sp.]|nr:hypothetical protein [Candidatus Angelobacter sp.]
MATRKKAELLPDNPRSSSPHLFGQAHPPTGPPVTESVMMHEEAHA